MQYINQLIDNISSNSDLLNFIGIFITVLVSIYIFKKESSLSLIRERHDKLIFPLFDTLEPILYQTLQADTLNSALQIIQENRNIVDGKLLELSYLCTNFSSQENFIRLCAYVDKAYDKSCRKLGLRLRSINYRIDRTQYRHISYFILYITVYTVVSFFIGATIFITILLLIGIAYNYLVVTDNINHPVVAIILLVFLLAFRKLINKLT